MKDDEFRSYLRFRNIKKFGHVRSFAAAQVLLHFELLLKLKYLPARERGSSLFLFTFGIAVLRYGFRRMGSRR